MRDRRMLLSNFNLLATAPGGVARLRELILTLAVQGKLVPQDPGDEPASVLLKNIRAEKDRLIAEGKIRQDKPLATIANEEKPFELPVGWKWVRLPEITYNLGQGTPTAQFTYIDVAGINNEKAVISGDVQIVEPADAPSRARKNVAVGTVLYSTIRPYLKNIAVVEKDYAPKAVASTAFAVMHPHCGLHSKYLLHYLRSSVFTAFVSSKAVGVAYPAINDGNFFEGVIALPPTVEQSRIVARVEELMRTCNALEAKGKIEATQHAQLVSILLGTLTGSDTPQALAQNWQRIAAHFDLLLDRPQAVDAFEQTILQLAVRGLLVPQDPSDEPASVLLQKIRTEKDRLILEGKIKRDKPLPPVAEQEKPFELPAGWEWARVGNLGTTATGGTPASNNPDYFGDAVPFIGPGQITPMGEILQADKSISELGCSKSMLAHQGDILMVCIGGSIGKCAAATYEVAFNQQINSIHPLVASSEYVLAAMSSANFLQAVISTATGSATPIISKGKWDLLLLPVPPRAEQSRIVTRVEALSRLCTDLRQHLSASQTTQAHLAEALVESVAG